jgi:multimeric flavodoxin WrbA
MKSLLITYHSQSGSTQRMADAVERGALRESDVKTVMLRAFDTTVQHLLEHDAYIFGTPENFGYMSGALKDLFDRTYYPTEGKLVQRPYAVFIKAGNDGSGALRSIERIVTGMQLKKVAEAVICQGDVSDDIIAECEELGQALAAGLALGIF